MIVALLGAESTGKTDLALGLADRARALGLRARAVEEYLREFCDRQGRTPRPEEQWHIAEEQTRRILAAVSAHDLVFADTTAVMTAVYSDLLFDDPSLYEHAFEAHRHCSLTLVTGLDLPWAPDGIQRDGPHMRVPIDARLRQRLQAAGVVYGVVYGRDTDRLDAAWRVVETALRAQGRLAGPDPAGDTASSRLQPWCRECLVPECEHLLLRRLLDPPSSR
ncbi:MAG: AAA family ATPase [Caldimonas sp.]|uniref:AAA family ATPase n=1 Tax=Caldimonas sp. TaxID=2838790 RepID=UPI00391C0618